MTSESSDVGKAKGKVIVPDPTVAPVAVMVICPRCVMVPMGSCTQVPLALLPVVKPPDVLLALVMRP
jgi:hypothetical protein